MTTEENKTQDSSAENSKEKALNQEIKRLKAQLARQGDEAAKKLEAARAAALKGKTVPFEVSGEAKITLVPTDGGKPKKVNVGIQTGFPKIRLEGTTIVSSQALMDLAAGKELSETQLAESPALKDWDQTKAVDFLAQNAAIGAGWIKVID